ncbi:MAG: hypothetical protein Q4P33_03770 [Flaviflexus sp.]|nr:hypothetical protein [Flaviflexus sp.]
MSRLAALAGVITPAAYILGDVLLLGGVPRRRHAILDDPRLNESVEGMLEQPSSSLRAGALAGALASPGYLAGGIARWRLASGPTGRPTSTAAAGILLLAAAEGYAGYIHSMFYPFGEFIRLAEAQRIWETERGLVPEDVNAEAELVRDPARPVVDSHALVEKSQEVAKAITPGHLVYFSGQVIGSALLGWEIARGRTGYSRLEALLVPPALPIAAAIAATARVKGGRHALRGAGLSLGAAISGIATLAASLRRA